MEPERSLPHSPVPATCPYPKLLRFSPYHHSPLPEDSSKYEYYPHIYAWIFQVVSVPQFSPPKLCLPLSYHSYMLHASPISFFSIWSPEQYWVRSTDHQAYSDQIILWTPGFNSQQVQRIFSFSRTSIPALGHNQPSTLWVPGFVLYMVKLSRTKTTLASLKYRRWK